MQTVTNRLVFAALATVIMLLFGGCEVLESATEPGNQRYVEIIRDGAKPETAFRELGMLTDEGSLGEQGNIEAKFLRQARRAGADAIIMSAPKRVGEEFKGLSIAESYVFKATMIQYRSQ